MTGRGRGTALVLEVLLALAVVASFGWTARFFVLNGFLPQPFVFDTNDTFMDWFNTAYWANNPGAFDVWRTIYPPLSFAFLDLTTLPGCYPSSSFYARDCDWLARAVIHASYLIDVALVWAAFRRADAGTAPMRTAAFALGLPLLFTLERGNLILVCFAFFVLAHGDLLRSKLGRAAATAATINFKPYLLLPVLALAFKRQWRPLELAGIATVALYLVTLAMVGAGSPQEIMSNTANWVAFQGGQALTEVNYSTSYAPLLAVPTMQLPVLQFVPSKLIDGIAFVVPLIIRTTQVIALAALCMAWVQRKAVSSQRIAALLLGAYLVTQSPGGYAQTFLLFLVMLEPFRRPGPIAAVICAYLLCLVGDIPLASIMEITSTSWLSDRTVMPIFGLTWGHFIRPGLIVAIVWALSLDTILRAARAHGFRRPVLGLAPA